MSRFVIQSALTHEFLSVLPTGDVGWTPSLLTAMANGIVEDEEMVVQLIADHGNRRTSVVIDLDFDYS